MENNAMQKPIKRSALRSKSGLIYYSFLRRLLWLTMNRQFAKTRLSSSLPFVYFTHDSPFPEIERCRYVDAAQQSYELKTCLRQSKRNRSPSRRGIQLLEADWQALQAQRLFRRDGLKIRHLPCGVRRRSLPAFQFDFLDDHPHASHRNRTPPPQL